MKSINMTKKQFSKLKKLPLSNEIINVESQLYIYKNKIIKKYFFTNYEYLKNKIYTIRKLNDSKEYLPENFVIPNYFFSINDKTEGLIMKKIEGTNLATILKDKKIDPKEKISYLKQIGHILEKLDKIRKYTPLKTIYLNDINESNFIINSTNKEINVVDLDSIKIENNKIFPAKYLSLEGLLSNQNYKYQRNIQTSSFTEGFYIPNQNTDLYCYYMIILNYLYQGNVNRINNLGEFYNYLNYLDSIGLNKNLLDCFANIISSKDNINPLYYLDSLTYEIIARASQKVYNLKKKN